MSRLNVAASLSELAGSLAPGDLTPLHTAAELDTVRELVVITDIEEITAVGPDTLILLAEGVARGGWVISAALRYAWERRACALVVPEQAFTDAVIELAKQLSVSLFTSGREIIPLSIDLAVGIGMARARAASKVRAFAEAASSIEDLDGVLQLIIAQLGAGSLHLETGSSIASTVVAKQGKGDSTPDNLVPVTVPVSPVKASLDRLVASVLPHEREQAEQLLTAAAPTVRAILADTRLSSLRASLPLISAVTLTAASPQHELDEPQMRPSAGIGWPMKGSYRAICLIGKDIERLASTVQGSWINAFGDIPLAIFEEGWFAILQAPQQKNRKHADEWMTTRLQKLAALGLRVGVSQPHEGEQHSAASVREAWLAARVATGSPAVLSFNAIEDALLPRLMPESLAAQLLSSLYPEFANDASAHDLSRTVRTYFDCQGSITVAAAKLGVHRNTLQQRLRRASELGLPLDDPGRTLALHLLLAAVAETKPT